MDLRGISGLVISLCLQILLQGFLTFFHIRKMGVHCCDNKNRKQNGGCKQGAGRS